MLGNDSIAIITGCESRGQLAKKVETCVYNGCRHCCVQTKDAKSKDGKGGIAIKQPYLRVVGLEQDIEGDAHNSPTFT